MTEEVISDAKKWSNTFNTEEILISKYCERPDCFKDEDGMVVPVFEFAKENQSRDKSTFKDIQKLSGTEDGNW